MWVEVWVRAQWERGCLPGKGICDELGRTLEMGIGKTALSDADLGQWTWEWGERTGLDGALLLFKTHSDLRERGTAVTVLELGCPGCAACPGAQL